MFHSDDSIATTIDVFIQILIKKHPQEIAFPINSIEIVIIGELEVRLM